MWYMDHAGEEKAAS